MLKRRLIPGAIVLIAAVTFAVWPEKKTYWYCPAEGPMACVEVDENPDEMSTVLRDGTLQPARPEQKTKCWGAPADPNTTESIPLDCDTGQPLRKKNVVVDCADWRNALRRPECRDPDV
jgi:hypothetical protein